MNLTIKTSLMVVFIWGLSIYPIFANAYDIDISRDKLLVPDFVKAQIVSDGMNMNGMDLGIIQFQTDRKFSDIEKFYRQEVGEIKIGEFEEWKIISWVKRKKLFTVQATYDEMKNRTHGFIAMSDLPAIIKSGKNVEVGKGFPALKKSEFINDIKATDLNKKSRTIWLTNHSTVRKNIEFYKNRFQNKGWQLEQSRVDQSESKGSLMMKKGADELNLTATRMTPLKEVSVVAVIVKK